MIQLKIGDLLKLAPELQSKIDSLWDKFWSGGIANPLTAIEQMSYLIFMKRLEDLDVAEQKKASAKKQNYRSVFWGKKECKWSHWKHMSAEEMLPHVRDTVFPFIKNVQNGEKTLFSQHMKDAVFMIPKPSLLQEAVLFYAPIVTEYSGNASGPGPPVILSRKSNSL